MGRFGSPHLVTTGIRWGQPTLCAALIAVVLGVLSQRTEWISVKDPAVRFVARGLVFLVPILLPFLIVWAHLQPSRGFRAAVWGVVVSAGSLVYFTGLNTMERAATASAAAAGQAHVTAGWHSTPLSWDWESGGAGGAREEMAAGLNLVLLLERISVVVFYAGVVFPVISGYGGEQVHILARRCNGAQLSLLWGFVAALCVAWYFRWEVPLAAQITATRAARLATGDSSGGGAGGDGGGPMAFLSAAREQTDQGRSPLMVGGALMEHVRFRAFQLCLLCILRPLQLYRGPRPWNLGGTKTMFLHSLQETTQETLFIFAAILHCVYQFPAGKAHVLVRCVSVAGAVALLAPFAIWYWKRKVRFGEGEKRRTGGSTPGDDVPSTPNAECVSSDPLDHRRELLERNGMPKGGLRAFFGAPGRPELVLVVLHVSQFVGFSLLSNANITAPHSTIVNQLVFLLAHLATYALGNVWCRADAWAAQRAADESRDPPYLPPKPSARQGKSLAQLLCVGICTVVAWVVLQLGSKMDAAFLLLVLVPVLWVGAVLAVAQQVPTHLTLFCNPAHSVRSLSAMRRFIYSSGARLYPAVHVARALGTKILHGPGSNAFIADAAFMLEEPSACVASFCTVSVMVACMCVHGGLSRLEVIFHLGVMALVVFPLTFAQSHGDDFLAIRKTVVWVHVVIGVVVLVCKEKLDGEAERRSQTVQEVTHANAHERRDRANVH